MSNRSRRQLTPEALAAQLRKEPARVVLGIGTEGFLREAVERTVAEVVLGDPMSPAVVTLHGAQGSVEGEREAAETFFGECRTGSLFGPGKVVVLRHADGLLGKQWRVFKKWLESPSPGITAVVLAEVLPPSLGKVLGEHCVLVSCGEARRGGGRPAGGFAARAATDRGKRLGRREAELLTSLIGNDLGTLDNAVEMLAIYAGEAPEITGEDIEVLFRSAREGSVWSFGDLLLDGNVSAALVEAGRCYAEGIPEHARSRKVTRNEVTITRRLLIAFSNSVTRAHGLRCQMDAGVPRNALHFGGSYPPPPAARKRAVQVAARRGRRALDAMLLWVEDTDRGIKSGGVQGYGAISKLALAVGTLK